MKTSDLFKQLPKDQYLPAFIDLAAQKVPDQTFISIPADLDNAEQGWRDISFKTFAQSVDRAATWLYRTLGPSESKFQPIHFLLPGDLANSIFVLASWKAGYSGIFCHPEAPAETHESINQVTNCKIVCFSGQLPSKAVRLVSAEPVKRVIAAPPLDFWLDGPDKTPVDLPFPSYTAEEIKASPLATVHSSGTTGIPKPITLSHGRFMSMVRSLTACDEVDRLNYAEARGGRVAVLVPITIAAGLFHHFGANFIYDWTPVLRNMTQPMGLKVFDDMMRHADISGAVTTPKILPGILDDEAMFKRFSDKMRSVIYAGAPLSKPVGDILTHHTRLSAAYGSTETGVYPMYQNAPEDWAYFEFDPVFGSALQPVGELGYHEIVIPKTADGQDGPFQAVFDLYPDIDQWRTKDIFMQHTDNKKLWRYVGRAEDLISDGLLPTRDTTEPKPVDNPFLPNEMEAAMITNKEVGGAVICENRAGDIAMVVEPWPVRRGETTGGLDEKSRRAFVDAIWPAIQAANDLCLVNAKVRKELVVVATEPLSRGTKGDPQRPWAQQRYQEAIGNAYAALPQQATAA